LPFTSAHAHPPESVWPLVINFVLLIEYLYTPLAQDIVGRNYYRPRASWARLKYADQFPPLELFTVDEIFGGRKQAEKVHFAQDGIVARILRQ
jgi:sulfate transport system substrate-binding protein